MVSFWLALSALTFWNWMVMLGWSLWKSAAIFFIVGSLPTHDEKVTVTGEVGSLTGPGPFPMLLVLAGLLPAGDERADQAEGERPLAHCWTHGDYPWLAPWIESRAGVTDATCKSIGFAKHRLRRFGLSRASPVRFRVVIDSAGGRSTRVQQEVCHRCGLG